MINKIKSLIYRSTKQYRKWVEESTNTESYKKWIDSGAKSYSDTHDIMTKEICNLKSYRKWWKLKEMYYKEKTDYLKDKN